MPEIMICFSVPTLASILADSTSILLLLSSEHSVNTALPDASVSAMALAPSAPMLLNEMLRSVKTPVPLPMAAASAWMPEGS